MKPNILSGRSVAAERALKNGWQPLQHPNHIAQLSWEAAARIQNAVRVTPLLQSNWMKRFGGFANVNFKLESEQITNSFKARGAVNKILSLDASEVSKGLVTSSTGNHALAFVYATSLLPQPVSNGNGNSSNGNSSNGSSNGNGNGIHSHHHPSAPVIYLPRTVSEGKLQKLREAGAHLVLHGEDSIEAEMKAKRIAEAQQRLYVSPYNDLQVIAGQGTVATDLLQQLSPGQIDAVLVPVGGGGLMAGMASVIKAADPSIKVIGCQPAASDVMRQSVLAGHIVQVPNKATLSDGTAVCWSGGIEPDTATLDPCMEFVDSWVTLEEEEIATAMVSMLHHHSKLIEGSAACAVAGLLKLREQLAGANVVVVCCGGNVSMDTLQMVMSSARPLP